MMRIFSHLFATVIIVLDVHWTCADVDFKWEYMASDETFQIEISSSYAGDASERYVAVAFGLEPQMKDADGFYCNNKMLKSFVIRDTQETPYELNSLQGAQLKAVSDQNGKLTCSFSRPVNVKKTISGGVAYDFNFSKESYYVLTASGELSGGAMQYHVARRVSSSKVAFSSAMPNYTPVTSDRCDFIYKSCLTAPSGCTPVDPECTFFSVRQVNDRILIELGGGVGNGQQYVAVAFASHDKMNDADLYYCDGNQLRSGVIRNLHAHPTDLNDTSVQVLKSSTVNGVGQCVFTRPGCVTKEVSSGIRKDFDLLTESYYILLAHGNMTISGNMMYHGNESRLTTAAAVPLGTGEGINYQCQEVDFAPEVIDSGMCDLTKYCLRHPNNCHPSSPECTFVSIEQDGSQFEIEMSGGVGGKEYIAVGFALTTTMEDMDFYYCDGVSVKSGIIRDGSNVLEPVSHKKDVLNAQASVTRGIGHCRFTRPACVTRKISGQKKHSFDLLRSEYLINIAIGSVSGDGRVSHSNNSGVTFVTGGPIGLLGDLTYECVSASYAPKPSLALLLLMLLLTFKNFRTFL